MWRPLNGDPKWQPRILSVMLVSLGVQYLKLFHKGLGFSFLGFARLANSPSLFGVPGTIRPI